MTMNKIISNIAVALIMIGVCFPEAYDGVLPRVDGVVASQTLELGCDQEVLAPTSHSKPLTRAQWDNKLDRLKELMDNLFVDITSDTLGIINGKRSAVSDTVKSRGYRKAYFQQTRCQEEGASAR